MSRYGDSYGWRPYVSVAARKRNAAREMSALRKAGQDVQPVTIAGRKIATTFWGAAWCDHLESFSDYSNRLPRGRSYVRNGSVCHLGITQGDIDARVAGSELYAVRVQIKKLPVAKWRAIKQRSAGQIGSLLELLQGKLSDQVMQIVTDRDVGLFPLPKEISFACDCPDWAGMCKHIAAVMYGVGARLDTNPELLFTLREVDHEELIAVDAEAAVSAATASGKSKQLAADDLSDVFGIDLDFGDDKKAAAAGPTLRKRERTVKKKSVKKKVTRKKTVTRKKAVKKTPRKATKRASVKHKTKSPPTPPLVNADPTQRTTVRKKKK